MVFYVYILRTSSNTLYIGQTSNLEKRMEEHRNKTARSAKYMRYFKSFELVYSEECKTRSEAMKREAELRKLSRPQKEALIEYNGSNHCTGEDKIKIGIRIRS
ncbi:GIY-YIG nuclease family protein [Patescibacteria group bacterium]|nr:GIY-YIG nuclease family protein [Patescibacteria group bacterium]